MPADDCQCAHRVKDLARSRLKSVSRKHIFRRSGRHLWKDWPAAGKADPGSARQKENAVAIEKHSEYLGPANHSNAGVAHAQHRQGLLQSTACRIPKQGVVVIRVARYGGNPSGQNQSPAQIRASLLLAGMTAVHDDINTIEAAFKKGLIGFELKRLRHQTCRIGKHAVLGDNGVPLDTAWSVC